MACVPGPCPPHLVIRVDGDGRGAKSEINYRDVSKSSKARLRHAKEHNDRREENGSERAAVWGQVYHQIMVGSRRVFNYHCRATGMTFQAIVCSRMSCLITFRRSAKSRQKRTPLHLRYLIL